MSTSKLVLSQVKLLLDKSLIENGVLSPQLQEEKLLKVVSETAEILQGQASLRDIKIMFRSNCGEVSLMLDKMRIQ